MRAGDRIDSFHKQSLQNNAADISIDAAKFSNR
jgi:hypothetical protein